VGKTKYAQKIIHFFWRPCGEYHLKTSLSRDETTAFK
jgi:hypothetical protein